MSPRHPTYLPQRAPRAGRDLAKACLTLALTSVGCNWMQGPAEPTSTDAPARRSYVPIILATPTPAPKATPTPVAAPAPAAPKPAPAPTPTPQAPAVDAQECHTPSLIRIKVHYPNGPNGWVIDSVALTCDRKFCASYKLPDGSSRECCPLGPEGTELRERCEDEMVPAGPTWQLRQGSHHTHPTNPWLHFVSPPASVRACLKRQGICSDWLDISGK